MSVLESPRASHEGVGEFSAAEHAYHQVPSSLPSRVDFLSLAVVCWVSGSESAGQDFGLRVCWFGFRVQDFEFRLFRVHCCGIR